MAALPTQASQRSVASAIKPNATSTANSGIARRAQELELDEAFDEGFTDAGDELGGAALDDAAAVDEEDDVPDALEFAADDGLVCSC
jgi:hypothetical protein